MLRAALAATCVVFCAACGTGAASSVSSSLSGSITRTRTATLTTPSQSGSRTTSASTSQEAKAATSTSTTKTSSQTKTVTTTEIPDDVEGHDDVERHDELHHGAYHNRHHVRTSGGDDDDNLHQSRGRCRRRGSGSRQGREEEGLLRVELDNVKLRITESHDGQRHDAKLLRRGSPGLGVGAHRRCRGGARHLGHRRHPPAPKPPRPSSTADAPSVEGDPQHEDTDHDLRLRPGGLAAALGRVRRPRSSGYMNARPVQVALPPIQALLPRHGSHTARAPRATAQSAPASLVAGNDADTPYDAEAEAASRSISALSAFISFCSSLAARFIDLSTLAPMSETATTTRPAVPASRCSPNSLRS